MSALFYLETASDHICASLLSARLDPYQNFHGDICSFRVSDVLYLRNVKLLSCIS